MELQPPVFSLACLLGVPCSQTLVSWGWLWVFLTFRAQHVVPLRWPDAQPIWMKHEWMSVCDFSYHVFLRKLHTCSVDFAMSADGNCCWGCVKSYLQHLHICCSSSSHGLWKLWTSCLIYLLKYLFLIFLGFFCLKTSMTINRTQVLTDDRKDKVWCMIYMVNPFKIIT